MERTVNTLWLIRQPPIDTPEYSDSMMSTLEAVSEIREEARMALAKNKQTLEKAYNKRVRSRTFALGDLVWRAILPLGKKDPEIGKWSPNWEGPYVIHQSLGKNVYRLKDMHGVIVQRTVNGLFLKAYMSAAWDNLDKDTQEQMRAIVFTRRQNRE